MSATRTQQSSSTSVAMSSKQEAQAKDSRQLTFELLTRHNDKRDGLKLIADSVAQQRQVSSSALIFHPISLSALVAVISLIHMNVEYIRTDYSSMLVTYSGILLSYLVAVRYMTSSYIRIAEETDWPDWLKNESGADDVMLGARFGSEIIAVVVLCLPNKTAGSKASDASKATIRAWTTKQKYRRHGLGGDMLRAAVKKTKESLGAGGGVEFADDNAHSNLLRLPATFNSVVVRRQAKAKDALSAVVRGWEAAQE